MKKFILTSTSFTGELYFVFSESKRLVIVDLSQADLSAEQQQYILQHLPLSFDDMDTFTAPLKNMSVVKATYQVSFDQFWNKYAQKRNRKRCEALWNKLSQDKQLRAYDGIDRYDRYLRALSWQRSKLDPDSYLSGERWEDDWK